MSSSSAAHEPFSISEAPTATSEVRASPRTLDGAALERREERKKRRWRCTTRKCPHRTTPLAAAQIVRVSKNVIHCPHCKKPTLRPVQNKKGLSQNWYCNSGLCERRHDRNQPITEAELQAKTGGAHVCPDCGDSITAAGPNGMLPEHMRHLPREQKRNLIMNQQCENPDDDLRDLKRYPGQTLERPLHDSDDVRRHEAAMDGRPRSRRERRPMSQRDDPASD